MRSLAKTRKLPQEAFRKAFPGHPDMEALYVDNSSLSTEGINILNTLAEQSNAPAYRGFYAYTMPLFGGTPASHTGGDLPYLFNNVRFIDYMVVGDEENAQAIATAASTALANFARTGDPSFEGIEWPAYTVETKAAMIFDTVSEVRNDFDTEFRSFPEVPTSMW